MRAPVYRNIDSKSSLLGLAFPGEVLVLLLASWAAMLTLPPGTAALVAAGVYAGMRLLGYGRPPMFLQHRVAQAARRGLGGGRLSAAARAAAPRLPFAPHRCRQAPGGEA